MLEWVGLPFPSSGDLPHPGIEPGSPALQADSLPFKPSGIWSHISQFFVCLFVFVFLHDLGL